MSVEVNVTAMKCGAKSGGLSCTYCYQGAVRRETGNAGPTRVEHEKVQAALAASGGRSFSLFGGEPLLASLDDLEKLWAYGLERHGHNGVQTSGRPIREKHLALFVKYKVHVGFSIDGPGELNDARRAGTIPETREASEHSDAMLRECLRRGVGVSLIVTLSSVNASPARLPALLAWLRDLEAAGLRSARLHALEHDGPAMLIALDHAQTRAVMLACHELERETALRFDVFADMLKLLRADDDDVTCTWNACDPWTTPAVHGIGPDGERYLCGRVHKDGVQWRPAAPGALVRQLVLAATPQADGGCQGCRFLVACKGQCPGTAEGGDWRRRSRDCALWFALLEDAEREVEALGEVPVSKRPDLPAIEARMKVAWAAGHPASIKSVVQGRAFPVGPGGHGDQHGDQHGDRPHGDHTDHADHGDTAAAMTNEAKV